MYEAVFFDLDGTLYDKRGLSARLIWAALRRGRPCLRLLALERKVRRLLAGSKAGFEDLFVGIALSIGAREGNMAGVRVADGVRGTGIRDAGNIVKIRGAA